MNSYLFLEQFPVCRVCLILLSAEIGRKELFCRVFISIFFSQHHVASLYCFYLAFTTSVSLNSM